MSVPDGGPAFPTTIDGGLLDEDQYDRSKQIGDSTFIHPGMTLRDYFAAKAIPGLQRSIEGFSGTEVLDMCSAAGVSGPYALIARRAYEIADAMIAHSAEGM